MKTRRTKLRVTYESSDITSDLQPHLLSWTYTDNLSGQADDLQINLEDKQGLWSGPWMPGTGALLKARIERENWELEGRGGALPLGQFEIDEIEVSHPPSAVSIKAISVPESSSLRGEMKQRAWENTKLSVIAGDIASPAGMELLYDVQDDPEYDRAEQDDETDLSFLMRMCSDSGFCLKVTGSSVVIFDEEKYEAADPVLTIYRTGIKSFRGRKTTQGLYKACRVEYQSPAGRKSYSSTYTPPNAPVTGRTLRINQRVSSDAEAHRLARKKLREANKKAVTVSVVLPGDTRLVAGITVQLSGFGKFDGKYIVTQATHNLQAGYETSVELRLCLEGY